MPSPTPTNLLIPPPAEVVFFDEAWVQREHQRSAGERLAAAVNTWRRIMHRRFWSRLHVASQARTVARKAALEVWVWRTRRDLRVGWLRWRGVRRWRLQAGLGWWCERTRRSQLRRSRQLQLQRIGAIVLLEHMVQEGVRQWQLRQRRALQRLQETAAAEIARVEYEAAMVVRWMREGWDALWGEARQRQRHWHNHWGQLSYAVRTWDACTQRRAAARLRRLYIAFEVHECRELTRVLARWGQFTGRRLQALHGRDGVQAWRVLELRRGSQAWLLPTRSVTLWRRLRMRRGMRLWRRTGHSQRRQRQIRLVQAQVAAAHRGRANAMCARALIGRWRQQNAAAHSFGRRRIAALQHYHKRAKLGMRKWVEGAAAHWEMVARKGKYGEEKLQWAREHCEVLALMTLPVLSTCTT
jgi:hypothetical protein